MLSSPSFIQDVLRHLVRPVTVWEPIRTPSEQWDGYYNKGIVDKPVPGPARMYSDVLMQTANDLANLPPFQAKAKIISKDDESKRPILVEHDLDNLNPNIADIEKQYYGTENLVNVARIREQSRKLTKTRQEVDHEITKRTFGAADENIREVGSHEVLPD